MMPCGSWTTWFSHRLHRRLLSCNLRTLVGIRTWLLMHSVIWTEAFYLRNVSRTKILDISTAFRHGFLLMASLYELVRGQHEE
ncbi:hypothetical protein I7I48_08674 [Histoplasma ohiense]|nr:hypothetical protein I7I48_08674 [Histoplasma ohiense (nom. inval.)]